MAAGYVCGTEARRNRVRNSPLNGIDFLEVDATHTRLAVHFLHPLPGQAGGVTAGPPLDVANFRIEGGARVTGIRVLGTTTSGDMVTVLVNRPGDFSPYTLRLVAGDGSSTPPGFDRELAAVEFSFTVDCPTDFDCDQPMACPEPPDAEPVIDYLAKDYASFRRLMLDRMALLAPELRQRNPADFVVATVEALAYVADQLSYYQDSVATEAYLGTARRRTSVRRHARLLDYPMHEGCSARVFVCLEVAVGGAGRLARGTRFFAAHPNEPAGHPAAALDRPLASTPVFESLHDLVVSSLRNRYILHTFSDTDCCLAAGGRSATLRVPTGGTDFGGLASGDYLVFEEVIDVDTIGEAAIDTAALHPDPNHRHVVRLTAVSGPYRDEVEGVDVVDIAWGADDALPFSLCISQTRDELVTEGITVARGNVVLCDHGQTLAPASLDPPEPLPGRQYRPALPFAGVSAVNNYQHLGSSGGQDSSGQDPAAVAQRTNPREARAAVQLRSRLGDWVAERDLLGAGPYRRAFVVEGEQSGASLRFGDGSEGREPSGGLGLLAVERVGNGRDGNVGHDTLTALAAPQSGGADDDTVDAVVAAVTRVWNPMPAAGGTDPEPVAEVKRYAPVAFREQERAVTEADYAAVAERHPAVQRAQASFHWTGSWYTVTLAVDGRDGVTFAKNPRFAGAIRQHMERFRMAGYDIELLDPEFVPVDIRLAVCVAEGYFRGAVDKELRDAFSSTTAAGRRGLFHPDNRTFGQALHVSQVVEAAMRVHGVETVRVTTFQRRLAAPAVALTLGVIDARPAEIIRCDSDPSFPENGSVQLDMESGR